MTPQFNSMRTLVVEDSKDERVLLRAQLRYVSSVKLLGFVHDGIEAIAYLQGDSWFKDREMFPYPDLMLLDFKMPRCDGMDVLDFLRTQFHRPRVILWSTSLEQINVALALQAGADLACKKPKDSADLTEIIRRIEAKLSSKARYGSPVLVTEEAAISG